MAIEICFETHSTSEDNERGLASGWSHSQLSAIGREQARRLGERRPADGIGVVFASDLNRVVETAKLAFPSGDIPLLLDWRLRECDYGDHTRMPAVAVHRDRARHVDAPYPGGESWRQAADRVGRFLGDLALRWSGNRVLVIGHVATRWGLDHRLNGIPLDEIVKEGFVWQEGWEYRLDCHDRCS